MENFKEIPGFNNYLINEYGDIYSLNRKIILSPNIDKDGYYRIGLCGKDGRKYFRINRLVAMVFLPHSNKELTIVNHLDGDIKNNHYTNLEWTTPRGNTLHAIENKLSGSIGETNHNSKLKYNDICEIRSLYQQGFKVAYIQKIYNIVTWETIKSIVSNKNWTNI